MDNARKKNLVREFREAKQRAGIVSLACTATGERWIGTSRNLDKQRNGLFFQLRLNSHPNNDVQSARNAHGEPVFVYEIVKEIADENPLVIGPLLKDREAFWRKKLGAEKLTG